MPMTTLAMIATCAPPEPRVADAQLHAIVDVLTRQNPNPVNVSPSGELVLMKSMRASDFELEVRRRRDDVVVAHDLAGDTQLAPTWRFDDGALAFLSDHDGDQQYRPFVLDIASGTRRAIANAPVTAVTALRWEPRGTRIAYLVAERGRRARSLAVIDTAGSASSTIVASSLHEHAGFVWSADGRSLAGVSQVTPGRVVIADSVTGATRELLVAADAELRSLAWSDDGARLLVTLRRASEEYFGLAEVSVTSGTTLRELHAGGDISGPLYLPSGGLAFHVNHDGEVGVFVCDGRCDSFHRIGPREGTSVITGFSRDKTAAWILSTGLRSPPALLGVELGSAASSVVRAARAGAGDGATAGERIDLASSDHLRVPAYLWRAQNLDGRAPAALIRVRGGPAGQAMRTWDPAIQFFTQHGVHVISVNYRGSSGYGASYERAPVHRDAERVFDVIAAREFAETELGVEPERIVMFGHSYGALLVAEAARRDPRPVGAIVLASYVGPAAPRQGLARVVVFHGENDVALSPAEARRRLAARFGSDVLEPPRGQFIELAREGHTFRRVETWARVYATVLALLRSADVRLPISSASARSATTRPALPRRAARASSRASPAS